MPRFDPHPARRAHTPVAGASSGIGAATGPLNWHRGFSRWLP